MQKGKPFVQCKPQKAARSAVIEQLGVFLGCSGRCCGVGPCPLGNRSLLLPLPLQSSQGNHRLCSGNLFLESTCGHIIQATPAGSLELSGQQQMLCTFLWPWRTEIAVDHYFFCRDSSIACSSSVGGSFLTCACLPCLGGIEKSSLFLGRLSECHHSLQSGSTVLFMQFISQSPVIRKAKLIAFCGGAGWSVLSLALVCWVKLPRGCAGRQGVAEGGFA